MARQKSTEYRSSPEYKKSIISGQEEWRNSLYGPAVLHTKICENKNCGKPFEWFGRAGTTKYRLARYCSIACSKSRSEFWEENASNYRTIAFRHHECKCVVCGFDKIVSVHHYDEDKKNNHPLNLVPLCPNHHEMIHHTEYVNEVKPIVDAWLEVQRQSGRFI